MGPGTLSRLLEGLPEFTHPNLLVSGAKMDDAGVYKISEDLALVQTVDFFTPMVDDPYVFGQVAAANALSDVYAMGAEPLTAMNITAFPTCSLDLGILRDILAGGAEKVKEAGALLVGGHTIEDKEPKYGLAVTGTVHPAKVLTNQGAQAGDALVLTKPLGIGILTTAIKAQQLSQETMDRVIETMATLNKGAAEVMKEFNIHACTDITGFGLLGHTYEMAAGSEKAIEIEYSNVPLLPDVLDMASMGIVPGGARRNRDYLRDKVVWQGAGSEISWDVLCDPQTSGGLLVALPGEEAGTMVQKLNQLGNGQAAVIGRIVNGNPGQILVKE